MLPDTQNNENVLKITRNSFLRSSQIIEHQDLPPLFRSDTKINRSDTKIKKSIQVNGFERGRRSSLTHQKGQIEFIKMKFSSEYGDRKENIWEKLYKSTKKSEKKVVEKEPELLTKMKTDFDKLLNNQSSKNDKDAQKFRMHEFIFQKKKQAKLKYNDATENVKNYALPVPKGNMTIMMNPKKKNYTLDMNSSKDNKRLTQKDRFKKKWKTVQWLMENKKEPCTHLLKSSYEHYNKFFKKAYEENARQGNGYNDQIFRLSKQEFADLLSYSGIGGDNDLIDKQFFIFDNKKSGFVNYIELQVSFEIFKDSPYDEKIHLFIDLGDQANTGFVNQTNVYDVFKIVCKSIDEKIRQKRYLREISENLKIFSIDSIDKNVFYDYSKNFIPQKNQLSESIRQIRKVNKLIENDVQEHFQTWVPLTNKIVKLKEGFHFPLLNQVIEIAQNCEEANMQKKNRMKRKNLFPNEEKPRTR